MRKRISELVPGDLVDLQGDQYADPGEANPDCSWMECNYARVDEIEHETPTCTRVDFDAISVGFPPDHIVNVADVEYDNMDNPIVSTQRKGALS